MRDEPADESRVRVRGRRLHRRFARVEQFLHREPVLRFQAGAACCAEVGEARDEFVRPGLLVGAEDLVPGELGRVADPAGEQAGAVALVDGPPVGVPRGVEVFAETGLRGVGLEGDAALGVVLEVFAHVRVVDSRCDAEAGEERFVAYPGEFEDLWGFHRSAGDDDFGRGAGRVASVVGGELEACGYWVAGRVAGEEDVAH